jgi:ribosome recycling factor
MAYDFKPFDARLAAVSDWLGKELSAIRTGRANVAILDGVLVESYGSRMPINQLASVSAEDPRTLKVAPWDQTVVKAIEAGIRDADLGLSVMSDGKVLRVVFPELTAERREMLIKQAGKKLEEARISLRKERQDCWDDIQAKEKEGGMSEDDKLRHKDEMQKKVDDLNAAMEKALEAKESEIRG